ncbi:MAG TPA: long-chain-fatty-acid--CoA ligase [Bryobacteraceae bacterium]|nr:long-chain-fatty-acid--CoA ligase [Bryobacteraceae bacterium]
MFVPLTPIRCLHRAVDLFGHKIGVVCGERQFTYREFGERAERLATALVAAGIRPGDRVAYLSFNTHQLLEGYFGVVQAHAIVMPLNVRLSQIEIVNILNHSGARMLLFENDFAPLVEKIRPECPGIQRYVTLDDRVPVADTTYEELLAKGHPQRADVFSFDERSIAELFYTSGSTGTPKGVALSHRTLYLHAMSVATLAQNIETAVDLHTIPLFHANGWGRPQSSTMLGVKQVMVRRFEPATVFRLIQEHRATEMNLVPTMANALLNAPDLCHYDCSSMRRIMIGGAAASPELIDRVEKAFGCECIAGYGLTETAPVLTSARSKGIPYVDDADRVRHQAMAGWAVPGVALRVVDLHMQDVPRDMTTIGEVVAMGDHIMEGYFHEPEATAAVMSGPWFHTGDMAVWDQEGYIHIVDRKKEIIISGGENISSLEVEKAIFAHPAVFECAVIAAPDEKWGEVPVAIVVPKPDAKLTPEELLEFLQLRLGKFKLPRVIEISDQPLPKTGTGKIRKLTLRERFWAGKEKRVQG